MKTIINRGHSARLLLASAAFGASILFASQACAEVRLFSCSAAETGVVLGSRIHVRCDPGDQGGINFFAIGIGNPDASRVLSLASTAVVARRQLNIVYDTADSGGVAIQCLIGNCRLIQQIFLEQN
jgi:hypothetical protein